MRLKLLLNKRKKSVVGVKDLRSAAKIATRPPDCILSRLIASNAILCHRGRGNLASSLALAALSLLPFRGQVQLAAALEWAV